MGNFSERMQGVRSRLHLTREKPASTCEPRPPERMNRKTLLKEYTRLQRHCDSLKGEKKKMESDMISMERRHKEELDESKLSQKIVKLEATIVKLRQENASLNALRTAYFLRSLALERRLNDLQAKVDNAGMDRDRCQERINYMEYLKKGRERLEKVE
ncbi:uncharacterized protein QC763_512037 [Podospora pseudopauciseta]|uniref:Uncharacterized protein n=1 Tax=Podospora pseudopauciseta TaxID=2093780 RepID=A0ABR0H952_9PEZI|nr:hypothetical protein QC763_512037 [Podospora pseudopauciseta]